MSREIIRDGKGLVIGYIYEEGNGNRAVQDRRGITLGRYLCSSDWTLDVRTGKIVGYGDQLMRLLGE